MKGIAEIDQVIEDIVEEFEDFEEPQERFSYIIEVGRDLAPLPEEYYTDSYKVEGCVSQVWLHAYLDEEKVYLEADSDAAIVKGLISLLIRVYSGHTPKEILGNPPDFLQQSGISSSLSPNRSNGLASMVKKIQYHAERYQDALDAAGKA